MKKMLLALMALFVFSTQYVNAQNYEIEYRLQIAPEFFDEECKDMGYDVPKEIVNMMTDNLNKAKIIYDVQLSEDQMNILFNKSKSDSVANMMGATMDVSYFAPDFNFYVNYAKHECYVRQTVKGKDYLVKESGSYDTKYAPSEGSKTILGHECKLMKSENFDMWYATDMPYETKVFKGVPGLVLQMDRGKYSFVAVSFKESDKQVTTPQNIEKITGEEFKKLQE